MTLGIAVGKRILELINEKDISQYRLAKNTCLDYKTINDLLNKQSNDAKLSTVYLIANELNMTLEHFFDSPLSDKINIEIIK